MIASFFKHLSTLRPDEEVLLGSIADQFNLAPQVISAVLLGAEDEGLLTCYAPDSPACRWVVRGELGAWIERQQRQSSARLTRRQQMWGYMQRKKQFAIADLVALGHKYNTVANFVKELRGTGELAHLGKGIYSCRPEEVR